MSLKNFNNNGNVIRKKKNRTNEFKNFILVMLDQVLLTQGFQITTQMYLFALATD